MRCSAAARPRRMAPLQPQNLRCTRPSKVGRPSRSAMGFVRRGANNSRSIRAAWPMGTIGLRCRSALTLIELLLTLAVLGILAAILIPQLSGDLPERLSAAAQVVSTDLDYA